MSGFSCILKITTCACASGVRDELFEILVYALFITAAGRPENVFVTSFGLCRVEYVFSKYGAGVGCSGRDVPQYGNG